MKNVAGDDECCRRRGEGELEKKKKKKTSRCVREVREKKEEKKNRVFCSHFIFIEMMRCQHVNGRQKPPPPPFCPIRISAALYKLLRQLINHFKKYVVSPIRFQIEMTSLITYV
jgi:hypothetical protein